MPSPVDPAAREKYLLEVTAGPSYDSSTHTQIPVNKASPTLISSNLLTAHLHVRIKDYHGLPPSSPCTSPYFQHELHTGDRYSISYSFVPKRNIPGEALVMGFDYDHSIRHQLPPGTKTALKIATSLLDPGLYSDPYCEEPYLYGPALSSWFAFSVGDCTADVSAEAQRARLYEEDDNDGEGVVTEGGFGTGLSLRSAACIPSTWKKRRKHFLKPEALSSFVFEKDRMYHADFFNPHLDFANFSLRLPGFSISVARYVDDRTHHLRYVLKDRDTEEVGLVVFFKLLFGRELEERRKEMEGLGDEDEKGAATETNSAHQELKIGETRTGADEHEPKRSQHHVPEISGTPSRCPPIDSRPKQEDGEEDGDGIMATASTATSTLATSIYGVYVAMGFADSSSSSEPEGNRSSQPSSKSADAQIDRMDDATVEKYLQERQSSLN